MIGISCLTTVGLSRNELLLDCNFPCKRIPQINPGISLQEGYNLSYAVYQHRVSLRREDKYAGTNSFCPKRIIIPEGEKTARAMDAAGST